MTEKEIKKMSRRELLEILILQMKENERLQTRLENAATELQDAKKKLADKQICIMNAGSIAEAAFVLNNVFEAAEAAAAQYVENVKLLNERQQEVCEQAEREHCEEVLRLIENTEKQCREQVESTEEYCRKMTADTEELCRRMTLDAKEQCRKLTADTKEQCRKLTEDTEEQCHKLTEEKEQQCRELERITAEKCKNMEQNAQTKMQAHGRKLRRRK